MVKQIAVLLLAGMCAAGVLLAGTKGKIAGRVIDKATQEPLPGANVTIEGRLMGTASGIDGGFTIVDVPPGVYRVKAAFVGYAAMSITDVRVNVDQTTTLTFELSEQALQSSEVVVTAERPMVRKDATGSVSIISQEEIQVLPVANFIDVLRMRAGVVGEGSNLHVRGGRGNEVAYMIDGVYVEDPLFGGLGTALHNDAIEQMQFLSGTFSAEYGDAMSGVVNLVTREGTERFRFKVEGRTSEFASPFKGYHENRIVGSVSGMVPLISGLSFFATGEQDSRGSWLPYGYRRELSTLGKLTYQLDAGIKLAGSYRYAGEKHQNYNHSWKYIPEQYYQPRSSSHQGMAQWTHVLSPGAFYEIKASYFSQHAQLGVLDASGNYLDTSRYMTPSNYTFKADAGNGIEFWETAIPVEFDSSRVSTLNVKADLVWQAASAHELKLGVEVKQHDMFRFSVYDPKRNAPYINDYAREPLEGAFYLQDKMEFPSLILNVGLRVDYADQQASFRANPLDSVATVNSTAKFQVSPRIGIAHPISDRTNLSFSYGHFFQNPEYQFLYENSQYDLRVREPLFGQPDLDAQRTVAYQVSLSHQFTDNVAATVTAYYKDVTGLIGTRYFSPFVEGRYVGYTVYVNEDYANMKGFDIEFTMRRSKNVSGGLTYSYQVAKGSASSESEQYPGTEESTTLYFLSFDKTHSINGSVSLLFGANEGPRVFDVPLLENTYWNFIMRTSSGYPYTPGGRDVGFVIRNSARMPWSFTLDAEIGREIAIGDLRATVFLEALNLTNYRNVVYVYTDTGSPDVTNTGNYSDEYMKDPSNYGAPRRVRLGLRLAL